MSDGQKVILLGPTQAGKTQLLWAAHHSAQPRGDGMAFLTPRGTKGCRLDDKIGGEECLKDFVKLMIEERAPGGTVQGTETVRAVRFDIQVEGPAHPQGTRAEFRLFDPKGGWVVTDPNKDGFTGPDDFAPSAGLDDAMRQELFNVDSIIYCIPMTGVNDALDLDAFLSSVNMKKLKNVTLCVTKFDAEFLDKPLVSMDRRGEPRTHFSFAYNRDFASAALHERLARSDVRHLVDRLNRINNSRLGPKKEIKVMPVSAFGFVPGNGQANVRWHEEYKAFEMLTAVHDAENASKPTKEYPYNFIEVLDSSKSDSLWAPFQAFEAFLSVMFSVQQMREAGICVFGWDQIGLSKA